MFFKGRLGLRGPTKSNNEWDFDFFENFSYDYVNSSLVKFIQEFPSFLLLKFFDSAQIRFRVDASREKPRFGVWIDSKREFLESFAESDECADLQKRCMLELGQRGDLVKTEAHSWLPSFDKNNEEIPLFSYISSFSQPGPEANRALIACGMELVDELASVKTWAELGSGYGNLTAAYASLFDSPAWILEKEKRETELWTRNKKHFGSKFDEITFHSKAVETLRESESLDLLIADPPRSGFSEIFEKDLLKAKSVLLCSCDLKGLIKDAEALKRHYKLKKWSLVDLFPGTPYSEAVSLWVRV
jgi:tRNA/tmRNA/rRNA uracil-C5-methylase (TrmA/RlmC/RlmD family)